MAAPLPFATGETTDELPDVLCSTALLPPMARPGRATPPAPRRMNARSQAREFRAQLDTAGGWAERERFGTHQG